MKRRGFVKSLGIGAALAATPMAFSSGSSKAPFVHDPADYATVPEEDEEFQELEIDVPSDWAEESIVWL